MLLTMFFSQFAYVFAKAFQQRNVMGAHYLLIVPTSFAMSFVEIAMLDLALEYWDTHRALVVMALGTAGASASCAAVYFHKRMYRR